MASRPGYSLADVANSLPEKLRPKAAATKLFAKHPVSGELALNGATLHLLDNVDADVSATTVRKAIQGKKSLAKLINPAVGEYIKKMGLYKS